MNYKDEREWFRLARIGIGREIERLEGELAQLREKAQQLDANFAAERAVADEKAPAKRKGWGPLTPAQERKRRRNLRRYHQQRRAEKE